MHEIYATWYDDISYNLRRIFVCHRSVYVWLITYKTRLVIVTGQPKQDVFMWEKSLGSIMHYFSASNGK